MYRSQSPSVKCLLTTLFYGILIVVSSAICRAQESSLNTVDLYFADAPVSCKFVTLDDDHYWIYAVLDFQREVTDPVWAHYSWSTVEGDHADSTQVNPGNAQEILKWNFLDRLPEFITLRLNLNGREWIFQEHFPLNGYHGSGGVSLWESSGPMLHSWIRIGDSVQVKSSQGNELYTYFYGHDFDPARPPMIISPTGDSSLNIDSIFTLKANQFYVPNRQGLYFFQADSTGTSGVSLVVTDQ